MRNETQANVSLRSEAYANEALAQAAQQRADVVRVLGSKVVTRHNHQRVASKQHTVVWVCVTLSLSAFIGCLLAY